METTRYDDEEEREQLGLFGYPVFGSDGDEDDLDDDEGDEDDEEDADDIVDRISQDADDADGRRQARKNGGKGTKAQPNNQRGGGRGYVPPSEEEFRRMQSALSRLNAESKNRRQAMIERAKSEGMSEGEAKAKADAEEAALKKYTPMLVDREAKIALMQAGCRPSAIDRMIRLVDRAAVAVIEKSNGSYELIGLEDQVTAIQDDWPELFSPEKPDDEPPPTPRRPRGGDIQAGDRTPPPAGSRRQPRSSSEIALARLRGLE